MLVLVALALGGFACGCGGTTNGSASLPAETQVAPAMAAFNTMSGEIDASSDSVNSGADSSTGVAADSAAGGPKATASSIELNVAQDANLTATVDLDKTDGSGHDLYPYHTGKVNVAATGSVTGNFTDNGTGSLNGSVNYSVDETAATNVVYSRGGYSSTLAAGSHATHTLNAVWADIAGIYTHTITAHKVLSNVALTVTGPGGTVSPTVSCDVTAKSIRSSNTEIENSVVGWWEADFSGGHTVKVTLNVDNFPATPAGDVFVATVIVDGKVVSTNYSEVAFAARHPGCFVDLLDRFWLGAYIHVDDMFSNGQRAWDGWNNVIEGVSKAIDAAARANHTTPLNYQSSTTGSVTFPTADCPNLTGTVSYTATGSVSTDGATYADVNYSVSLSAATDLVYAPTAGYSATLASGANEGWSLAISVARTDASNYTIHFEADANQTIPSLTVTTPVDTTTISSAFASSGTYDEAAVAGVVSQSATIHAEWHATVSNSDGTFTAHKTVDLKVTG
ncbi:MAG: hypothetical protein ACREJ2_17325 [Planctomycetota bacterium]